MTQAGDTVLGWPQGAALRGNLVLSGIFATYFWGVYWLGNFVATHAARRFQVALPFEQMIPFVPWTAAIYLTITPLLLLAPFVLRTPARLLPLFATLCAEVTIAGVIFCVFPVELSFPSHEISGIAGALMEITRTITLQYNCVPSLHVALALTAAWAYAPLGGRRWRVFIWGWVAAIVASTLLAHQHHLADLAAGVALSILAVIWVPPRAEAWLRERMGNQSGAESGVQATRIGSLT